MAVVGCGRMGLPIARRLAAAGLAVTAFDVSDAALARAERAGAARANDAAAAAGAAEVLITLLPDPPAVVAAASGPRGVLAGLREGALWLEMTSSSPDVTAELAASAEAAGAELLDAPVSGGVAGAEDGTLTAMLGGPPGRLARARLVLDHFCAQVLHVGDRPGDGDVAKTLNNMLSATNLAAAAEALAIGMRAGLDPARLVDCINGGTGASHASQVKIARHVLSGRFAAGFTIAQYLKDLGIAHHLASQLDVPASVNGAARAVWTAHAQRGTGDADHTRIAELVVRDAGLRPQWTSSEEER